MKRAIEWQEGRLFILDQTLLPIEVKYIELKSLEAVWEAIKSLRVRGAPAIGICAAYGVLVGVAESGANTLAELRASVSSSSEYLATSRPTAVNLFWALSRMRAAAMREDVEPDALRAHLEAEADAIYKEETACCRAIGVYGEGLIEEDSGVLTHCNAGGLATGEIGTALAPMFTAHAKGKRFRVYADETRPLLQGARLTAWELHEAGIATTLICDNMAAQVMREGRIQLVITGADRIASNGDTANKIGTYGVALLAKAHNIPFYIAAPSSTFDFSLAHGGLIPIEERAAEEITNAFGRRTAPEGIVVYNPAFDVTPAELIAGFITEKGILRPPYQENLRALAHGRTI